MALFNDVTALAIAIGYLAGLYLLWSARGKLNVVASIGWTLIPAILAWVAFYLSVPIWGGMPEHRDAYVAVSRVAHSFLIVTLLVAGLVARKINKGGG